MKKKILSLFVVIPCLATIGVAVHVSVPREPEYQGKKLSAWLAHLDGRQSVANRMEAAAAVREMGTNILPRLVKMVGLTKSPLRRNFAAVARCQSVVEITPDYLTQWRAVCAFRVLGAAGKPAIPALVELLNDEATSSMAMLALVGIGMDSVPSLRTALSSGSAQVRANAEWGLVRLHVSV